MKIGIVENDEEFASFLRERLQTWKEVEEIYHWSTAEMMWRDGALPALDLALLDIHLPGLSGVELAAMLSERFPDMRKIMLTSLHSDEIVFQALKAGAVAYVLKSEMEDIQEVIRIVLNGGAVITPTVALRVMRHFQRDRNSVQALSQLTTREKQILEELSSGEAPRDISGTLQLSIHTVRQHIKNIYAKLQVSSRSELTRRLKELGIE
ncbi:MAG: response regulator transcription factor [Leptospiraceae bacterium]|nr:response regulator transcription factor [Leptospiraceae bacterium]